MFSKEKPLVIRFPVYSFRRIPTPYAGKDGERGPRNYMIVVKVQDLPKELQFPLETNPRAQNLKTKVAKKIDKALHEDKDQFFFQNRGLLLSVSKIRFEKQGQGSEGGICEFFFEDPESHGLVDGGHTYKILLDAITPGKSGLEFDQYVRIEVLEGVEDFFDDLAEARNTSNQVQDKSLDELRDRFQWIKKEIEDTDYGNKVAYKEYEDKEIDIRDVVSYLTLFNVDVFPPEKGEQPVCAFSSKKKCLDLYRVNQQSFEALRPLTKEILRLRDHIYWKIPEIHNAQRGRFGGLRAVDEKATDLYFLPLEDGNHVKAKYSYPVAYIYPVLGALRAIVGKDQQGECKWLISPFDFFDKQVGGPLVERTIEAIRKLGNPNAVGKDRNLWDHLLKLTRLSAIEQGIIKVQ